MGKTKKERCIHGLSPVYMQGCPHCVTLAMDGLDLLQNNGLDANTLFVMMHKAWPNPEAFQAAREEARAELLAKRAFLESKGEGVSGN